MKFIRNSATTVLLTVLCIMIIIAGLFYYREEIYTNIEASTYSVLKEITTQCSHNFATKLEAEEKSIVSVASMVTGLEHFSSEKLMEVLSKAVKETEFDRIIISDLEGNALSHDGIVENIKDQPFFVNAVIGRATISEPFISKFTGQEVIAVSTPIVRDGNIIAVLIGTHFSHSFNRLFSVSTFEGQGYAYVINQSGFILSRGLSEQSISGYNNLFNVYSKSKFLKYDDFDEIRQNMSEGKSGLAKYEFDGEQKLLYYVPLGINNWYVFSIVNEEIVLHQESSILFSTNILIFVIVALGGSLFFYVLLVQRHATKRIKEQVDRFNAISQESELAIFEYDILKNTATASAALERLFDTGKNHEVVYENFPYCVLDDFNIHPDDIDNFINFFEQIKAGGKSGRLEYRGKYTGVYLWYLLTITTIFDENGVPKKGIGRVSDMSHVDLLTGAYNKSKFDIDASRLIVDNKACYALTYLDIDRFKILNDSYGYEVGDEVLKATAKVISKYLINDEIFARLIGDQFLLMTEHTDNAATEKRLYKIMYEITDECKAFVGENYNFVLCAGVYAIENEVVGLNVICDRAKHANLATKGSIKNKVFFYDEALKERIVREKEIENKMESALANNEFKVYIQPKYCLKTETIVGGEALVRWVEADGNFIYPNQFIPVFEKNGFITKMDYYMFDKICSSINKWLTSGIEPVTISVNFSRLHLQNKSFAKMLEKIAQKYCVPSNLLEIELTENTIFDNEDVFFNVLSELHERGFTASMDDFGTGYSSLGLLKNLPVDVIKMDKTFFSNNEDTERARAVVSCVIEMAKELKIETVAEGVETKEHIDFLREISCDVVQGYYYYKPMPIEEFEVLISRNVGLGAGNG